MREIVFRGKRKDNGEWVYGYYDGCYETATINYLKDGIPWNVCVIPETVGQYTGLKDKNDKEIYEGDIVKNIKTGKMYTIKWHGVFSGFIYDDTFFNHSHKSDWGELHLCYLKIEVIGNIYKNCDLYKNPELLEVQNAE